MVEVEMENIVGEKKMDKSFSRVFNSDAG